MFVYLSKPSLNHPIEINQPSRLKQSIELQTQVMTYNFGLSKQEFSRKLRYEISYTLSRLSQLTTRYRSIRRRAMEGNARSYIVDEMIEAYRSASLESGELFSVLYCFTWKSHDASRSIFFG